MEKEPLLLLLLKHQSEKIVHGIVYTLSSLGADVKVLEAELLAEPLRGEQFANRERERDEATKNTVPFLPLSPIATQSAHHSRCTTVEKIPLSFIFLPSKHKRRDGERHAQQRGKMIKVQQEARARVVACLGGCGASQA